MNRMVTIFMLSFVLTQCSIDRDMPALTPSEVEALEVFENLEGQHHLRIAERNEPGQKLGLCLRIVSKDTQEPLTYERVRLYHTSAAGEYEPTNPDDESTARLNGTVHTNDQGQTFIQTILPGDYGSSSDNRHIHTTVENADPAAYDIHFKQFTKEMGKSFIDGSDQHFLAELKQTKDSTLIAFLTIAVKNYKGRNAAATDVVPDCEWCGAKEAPENTAWEATIANEAAAGERLIMEGTIYERDGETPAPDVVVYAYHTNDEGRYVKKGNETGNGVRHGYLRSWAKTNAAGKYRFHTIKPAPYPSHAEPAHIHMTLMREDFEEYWINATWFADDQIITDEMKDRLNRKGGFSNIIELDKNENETWVGKRDIILNPPEE